MNLLNILFKFKLKDIPFGNVKMRWIDNPNSPDGLRFIYKGYAYPINMLKLFEFFKSKDIIPKKSNIPELALLIELDEEEK